MIKRSARYYLLRGLVVLVVGVTLILGYAINDALQKEGKDETNDNLVYVSYEVLTDNVMPVISQSEEQDIIKPYTAGNVEIGKSYYDKDAEESNQEGSIIYYENTYIQNTGVDYTSKEVFDVNAIADGTVTSVTKDDIVGTTIKIEHNNDMISVYQSVKDVDVKANDAVTKGQVIAKSGTNNIGSDLGNHLHFELYKSNILVNPEEVFSSNQGN